MNNHEKYTLRMNALLEMVNAQKLPDGVSVSFVEKGDRGAFWPVRFSVPSVQQGMHPADCLLAGKVRRVVLVIEVAGNRICRYAAFDLCSFRREDFSMDANRVCLALPLGRVLPALVPVAGDAGRLMAEPSLMKWFETYQPRKASK